MATSAVKFYLDENLSPEIRNQLRLQGIDVIRGPLRAKDTRHLHRATAMGRVVCTEDRDFLRLASSGIEHAGIIRGRQRRHSIGDWVKYLQLVHAACDAEEMRNTVSFVFLID